MSHEIKVPPLGESIVKATVARWLKEVGDPVLADEIVVELETDKVTLEITAPTTGVLSSISHPSGESVDIGDTLGKIQSQEIHISSEIPSHSFFEEKSSEGPSGGSSSPDGSRWVDPAIHGAAVARLLNEAGSTPPPPASEDTPQDPFPEKIFTTADSGLPFPSLKSQKEDLQEKKDRRETRVPLTPLRQKIAEKLKEAQHTAAILTTVNEVDLSAVLAIRSRHKKVFEEKHGVKLGFMSFFLKATVKALQEIPVMNAQITDHEIIYQHDYHLNVAVSIPQGLVAPVIRGVESLSFAEIEQRIAILTAKAKGGKLTLEDLAGGTFTVSNGGIFGSLLSTPILNSPQVGILGMHKIQDRPVAIDGRVEICPMMYLSLSYDHRLIDGKDAVTFLVRIKNLIEDPFQLMLDV